MGYTATWAGLTTALGGILAVVMSPIVPRLMQRFDARALVTFGVAGLGVIAFVRAHFASNADYWTIASTYLAQGLVMPFLLRADHPDRPVLGGAERDGVGRRAIELPSHHSSGVLRRDRADAVGQRVDAQPRRYGRLHARRGWHMRTLAHAGMSHDQALAQLDNITQSQAVMLAADQMFTVMTVTFLIAACIVWLAPQPKLFGGPPGAAGGH